uniref:Uncharacterized protein LOC111135240 isoform X2 n=1 Tax=Crassostrea virginica TaxID=6565 RepID=A0A8B8ELP4_CRAVI|nr:uncharacterized protein LOC111135240 isoform X2 [Crassostrea virginica]
MASKVSILIACLLSTCYCSSKIQRGNRMCYTVKCPPNHIFTPCTENEGKDVCVPCEQGRFMPDIIDSSEWEDYSPFCLPNDCDQCDSTEAVLDNPDTCGITETARCVCDRTKLYYGVNGAGSVTSCTKKTGDLCDRPMYQLNQRGECERCPNGTEKTTADTSLCKKKENPTPTTSPTVADHPSTTLTLSEMGGKTTESTPAESAAIGAGIGVPVFVIVIVIIILCLYRKRKQRGNNEIGNKREKCYTHIVDSSDGSSHSSASDEPLMNQNTKNHFNNNSSISLSTSVKPTGLVKPMISVDESEKKGNTDSDDNIDDEIMHGGYLSEGTDINVQPVGQEDNLNSITEEKYAYSADETDLKRPGASCVGTGPRDWENTELKTVDSESEETNRKLLWVNEGYNENGGSRAARPQEQTSPKQVGLAVPNRGTVMVKPFGFSDDTYPKEIERDSFSERDSEISTVESRVSPPREGSVKPYVFSDTYRAGTEMPVTPNQAIMQEEVLEGAQDINNTPLERIQEEDSLSAQISNQSWCNDPSSQNSTQTPCHLTTESESSLPSKRVRPTDGKSQMLQGSNTTETVEVGPMSAAAAVITQSEGSIAVTIQESPAEKNQSHSSVMADEKEEEGQLENSGSIEGVKREGSTSPLTSNVVMPMVADLMNPMQQRVEPGVTRVQHSQQPIRIVDGNTERSRENSVSAAANRHDLLQNHSGSMVQNSSRQNSTASSGYDTAKIETIRETESSQSLGLRGLDAAPRLDPNSIPENGSGILGPESQNEYVPGPIKRESRVAIPAALEDSRISRNQPINPVPQQQNVNLESGYCS